MYDEKFHNEFALVCNCKIVFTFYFCSMVPELYVRMGDRS